MPLEPTNSLIIKLNEVLEPLLPEPAREALQNLYQQLLQDYLFLEKEHDDFVTNYQETLARIEVLEGQVFAQKGEADLGGPGSDAGFDTHLPQGGPAVNS